MTSDDRRVLIQEIRDVLKFMEKRQKSMIYHEGEEYATVDDVLVLVGNLLKLLEDRE